VEEVIIVDAVVWVRKLRLLQAPYQLSLRHSFRITRRQPEPHISIMWMLPVVSVILCLINLMLFYSKPRQLLYWVWTSCYLCHSVDKLLLVSQCGQVVTCVTVWTSCYLPQCGQVVTCHSMDKLLLAKEQWYYLWGWEGDAHPEH